MIFSKYVFFSSLERIKYIIYKCWVRAEARLGLAWFWLELLGKKLGSARHAMPSKKLSSARHILQKKLGSARLAL